MKLSPIVSILVGLLIGTIAGTLSGLFGLGGGVIIVPMLIFFLKFAPTRAVGTSLAAMLLPVGILAVMRYTKSGDVDFRIAIAMAVGIFVMADVGAHIGINVGNTWVSRGFGVLLILMGLKFVISG